MKTNLRFKSCCLYKLALISGLLFVALWFFLFSSLSFGNPESVSVYSVADTDNNLSVQPRCEIRRDKAVVTRSAQNSLASGQIQKLAAMQACSGLIRQDRVTDQLVPRNKPPAPSQTLSEHE